MSHGRLEEPISDGNGGLLDPRTATQRDLLISLHVKVDDVIVPSLRDHEKRIRKQEDGELSRGQKASIREVVQSDQDETVTRRNMKLPLAALLISFTALLATIILTILAGGPHV